MHKYLLGIAIAYSALIACLSLFKIVFTSEYVPITGSDKIGHFLAYFVFTIVWFLFFFYSEKQHKEFTTALLWAAILSFLFGILMEILQATLTSYRSPEWYDVLANTSGTILAVFFLKIFKNTLVSKRVIK